MQDQQSAAAVGTTKHRREVTDLTARAEAAETALAELMTRHNDLQTVRARPPLLPCSPPILCANTTHRPQSTEGSTDRLAQLEAQVESLQAEKQQQEATIQVQTAARRVDSIVTCALSLTHHRS